MTGFLQFCRKVLIAVFLMPYVVYADNPTAIMNRTTFIDSACIAQQITNTNSFSYTAAGSDVTDAMKPGAVSSLVLSQTLLAQGNTAIINKKINNPTYAELRVTLYNNMLRFVSLGVTAALGGNTCENPLSQDNCLVVQLKTPSGNDVTPTEIYQYVVYSALYDFISQDVLDANLLELVRQAIASTYSQTPTQTFQSSMENVIRADNFFTSGAINNQSIKTVNEKIVSLANALALQATSDILFQQQMGYSSKVTFPLTSRLIECLEGTFANLFLKDLPKARITPYAIVQTYFQPIIIAFLIIYIILYGYKILMAHGIKDNAQIIMTFVEFALVFYFTIGDAWQSFFFNALKAIPASIGAMIINALDGGADGCTIFKSYMYPNGKGNLALFDAIDCKFANYIGLTPNSFIPGIFWIIVVPMIIPVPVIGVIVSITGIVYFSCMVYTILLGIQVYISAVVSLSIMIFLSPFTIPMALFDKTEAIFNKWMAKIIGCVISLSFGLMIVVFVLALLDPILYGAKPEKYLFNDISYRSTPQNPLPNPVRDDCYFTGFAKAWAPSDGGLKIGTASFVPTTCLLHHLAQEGVMWIGFPLDWLYVFRIPINFRLDIMLMFVVSAFITILFAAIVKKFVDPLVDVIAQIGGDSGADLFGAQKYDGMKDAVARGTDAAKGGSPAKSAQKSASKTGKEQTKKQEQQSQKSGGSEGEEGGESEGGKGEGGESEGGQGGEGGGGDAGGGADAGGGGGGG